MNRLTPTGFFSALETRHGLPGGIMQELCDKESTCGVNMLNPESGAEGFFGIMPQNSQAAGIDPYDLIQSSEWTANYARKALERFPDMEPRQAILAHHFGGPDTNIWGPKTREYAGMNGAGAGLPLSQAPTNLTLPPGVLQNLPPLQPEEPSLAYRMASNPFIQMGLGILSANRPGSTFGESLGGAQKGLLAALSAEQAERNRHMQAVRQQLYNRQLQLQHMGLLQQGGLNPWQQARIRNWETQNAIKMAELEQGGGGQTSRDYNTAQVLYGEQFPGDPVAAWEHYQRKKNLASASSQNLIQDAETGLALIESLERDALGYETVDPETGQKVFEPGAFTGIEPGYMGRATATLKNLQERVTQDETKMERYRRSVLRIAPMLIRAMGDTRISNADLEAKIRGMAQGEWVPDTEQAAREIFQDLRREFRTVLETRLGKEEAAKVFGTDESAQGATGTINSPIDIRSPGSRKPKSGEYFIDTDGKTYFMP